MSASANPNIVTDGLVFKYDVGDIKSYRGEPTENLVSNPHFVDGSGDPTVSGYSTFGFGHDNTLATSTTPSAVGGGFSARVVKNTTSYGTIVGTVTIPALSNGDTVVVSWYAKGYGGNENQFCHSHCYINSSDGAVSTGTNSTITSEWKRFYHVFTWTKSVQSNTSAYLYFYAGFGTDTEFIVSNPQLEVYKSHPTPFVNGTRSATQGLLDRTGNSTIDLSNVSFDSNAQMVFDGTNDYVTATIPSSTSLRCLETWFYNENAIPDDDTAIGGPTSYQSLYCFNDSYPMGVNLGGWTGSGTNEAIHIWSSPSSPWKFTYTRDAVASGWHHLIFNWNGSTYDIWLDGQKQTVYASTGGHCDLISLSDLIIGNTSSPNYAFNGKNSITRIYNQSLTDAGILQNFNATKSRFGL